MREAEHKVQVEKDKIQKVETENEKYSVDHRTLEVYRQELTELLDSVKQKDSWCDLKLICYDRKVMSFLIKNH